MAKLFAARYQMAINYRPRNGRTVAIDECIEIKSSTLDNIRNYKWVAWLIQRSAIVRNISGFLIVQVFIYFCPDLLLFRLRGREAKSMPICE